MEKELQIRKYETQEQKWLPMVKLPQVELGGINGVVTLPGPATVKAGGTVAGNEPAKTGGYRAKTDAEIADGVIAALKLRRADCGKNIKIGVENGVVTLDGDVERECEKIAVKNAVINLPGVRAITNNILVAPKVLIGLCFLFNIFAR